MTSPAEPSSSSKRREPRSGSLRERARAPKPQKNNLLLWAGLLVFAIAASLGIKFLAGAASAVKTTLRVLDKDAKPLARCKLEFFVFDDSAAAAARPAKLGEHSSEKGEPISVPETLVPEYALVRASADGLGRASFLAQKGDHRENECKLLPAVPILGLVQDSAGQTLGAARIEAIGSGQSGLLLGETTSAVDGSFRLDGISPSMHHVTLRIAREGYAAVGVIDYAFDAPERLVCKLVPTKLITGHVNVPKGLSPKGLVVQTYALPGIATETDENGLFVLDHVPPNLEPKLILVSLPSGYTHRGVSAHPGQAVEIQVTESCQVSGTVIDERNGQIPQMAIVRHDHGPRGKETFRLDEFGRFVLVNVPEGDVTIEAFSGIRREDNSPYAAVALKFAARENKQDVAIKLK